MKEIRGLTETAELFKVLGSPSRLCLIAILQNEPSTVSMLVTESGLSQPLVSQHLKTLRQMGIVSVARTGREAVYQLADQHIVHIVEDARIHVLEDHNEELGETS